MKNPLKKHSRFSYLSQIHKDDGAVSTCSHQICCLLKYFGFNHVWENKTTLSVPKLIHALKKVMCSKYEQFFFAPIKGTLHKGNSSNKLRSYCKFKITYTFENYLAVKTDKTSISKYAKLKISNHRLNIELGRYAKTPVHLRTCNICNTL